MLHNKHFTVFISEDISQYKDISQLKDLNIECDQFLGFLSQNTGALEHLIKELIDAGCEKPNLLKYWKDRNKRLLACSYTMKSSPLGYCLIINNVEFLNRRPRIGSDVDADNLENIYKEMGFLVEKVRNLGAEAMLKKVEDFSKKDFSNVDACNVIILSHGYKESNLDLILGTDGKYVCKQSILSYFNNKKCESLIGKPKIFLFVSCRGRIWDYGVACQESPDGIPNTTSTITALSLRSYDIPRVSLHPAFSDMFIVHSTLPDHFSLRSEGGSWFVQEFVAALSDGYHDEDLETILLRANEKLMRRESEDLHLKQAIHIEKLGPSSKKIRFSIKSLNQP